MNNFKLAMLLIAIFFITGCKGKKENSMKNSNIVEDNILLPEYVTLNVQTLNSSQNKTIRIKAKELVFPLSEEDIQAINILEKKFDQEKNCAGLAAPQIGISKGIKIYGTKDLNKKAPIISFCVVGSLSLELAYVAL